MPSLTVSQGSLPLKSCGSMMRQKLRGAATGNNSPTQLILSSPKVFFIPTTKSELPHISTRVGPEYCILVNKCRACLDRSSAHIYE